MEVNKHKKRIFTNVCDSHHYPKKSKIAESVKMTDPIQFRAMQLTCNRLVTTGCL